MQTKISNIIEITTNANDDKLTIIQLENSNAHLSTVFSNIPKHQVISHTQFKTEFSSGDESNIKAISIQLNPNYTETHEDIFNNLINELSYGIISQEFPQDKNYSHTLIIHGIETLQIHWNDNTINILYHCTGQW